MKEYRYICIKDRPGLISAGTVVTIRPKGDYYRPTLLWKGSWIRISEKTMKIFKRIK